MARLETLPALQLKSHAVEKLYANKIFTVFDLVAADTENLMSITELSYKDILDIRKYIIKNYSKPVKTALQLFTTVNNVISTGISSLDNLLRGGLRCGSVYELCGMSSTGKTSICLAIATDIVVNSNFLVHYIDTKCDFSGVRVQMMLEERKISTKDIARALNQIKVTQVTNIPQLFTALHTSVSNSAEKIRLIIIDSLPSLFLVSTPEEISTLTHLANICRYLATECSLSVVTVNLVTQWREAESLRISSQDPVTVKPTLGKYWGGVPNTRINVEQINGKVNLTVWKSSDVKVGENCQITIDNRGIS